MASSPYVPSRRRALHGDVAVGGRREAPQHLRLSPRASVVITGSVGGEEDGRPPRPPRSLTLAGEVQVDPGRVQGLIREVRIDLPLALRHLLQARRRLRRPAPPRRRSPTTSVGSVVSTSRSLLRRRPGASSATMSAAAWRASSVSTSPLRVISPSRTSTMALIPARSSSARSIRRLHGRSAVPLPALPGSSPLLASAVIGSLGPCGARGMPPARRGTRPERHGFCPKTVEHSLARQNSRGCNKEHGYGPLEPVPGDARPYGRRWTACSTTASCAPPWPPGGRRASPSTSPKRIRASSSGLPSPESGPRTCRSRSTATP